MLNAAAQVREHVNVGKKFGESFVVPYSFAFTLSCRVTGYTTIHTPLRRSGPAAAVVALRAPRFDDPGHRL
jgi:hypothetical protein